MVKKIKSNGHDILAVTADSVLNSHWIFNLRAITLLSQYTKLEEARWRHLEPWYHMTS